MGRYSKVGEATKVSRAFTVKVTVTFFEKPNDYNNLIVTNIFLNLRMA